MLRTLAALSFATQDLETPPSELTASCYRFSSASYLFRADWHDSIAQSTVGNERMARHADTWNCLLRVGRSGADATLFPDSCGFPMAWLGLVANVWTLFSCIVDSDHVEQAEADCLWYVEESIPSDIAHRRSDG